MQEQRAECRLRAQAQRLAASGTVLCARDPGPPALGAEGWSNRVASSGHCSLSRRPRPALRAWHAGFTAPVTALFITNYKNHVKIKIFKKDDLKVEAGFPRHPSG